ncbi:MAG: translocation/assembly module TamB domain-containing protein [Bacteroidales bacterium]|nr:translocation/assembly module TamB domain-containing protein [Bacteroidales bacterium]
MLVIITLLAITFFVLQSSKIQTLITQKIAKEASENLNAKFEVESVSFKFFNRVVLKNVYIEDQLKDTLLFSEEIICNLKRIDRKRKEIDISNINLMKAKFYLHKFDSLQRINLIFAEKDSTIDTLTNDNWRISFQNIEMHKSIFKFKSYKKIPDSYKIVNFSNLDCEIEDLEIKNLKVSNGEVNFYTKKLKFTEKSGFKVHNVKFNASFGKQHMIFKNVIIRTPFSYINSDSLIFRHNDYFEYQQFAKNINLDFALEESNVSLVDLGYISPIFKNINVNAVLSGRFYNKLSSFKGKNVKIHIGEQTELITDFNLNGLPDHKQMFMYVDFKKLTTSAKDFEILNAFFKKRNNLSIPESFDKLGIISYKGNFAGFYDDFVTNGKFTSDLGNLSTDLSLQPDRFGNLAFSGNLQTKNFNIGELVSDTIIIGEISVDAQIKGTTGANKTVKATTKGIIHNFEINDYNYQNIVLDGFLTEKTFDGYFNISDPNIEVDFRGGIDFSKEIPVFNFKATVPNTNLYGLNIDRNDTTSSLSFNLNANFIGSNVDNAIGEINFTNALLIKFNEKMVFDTLSLVSTQKTDAHRIELKSEYIDALLVGSYKSASLIQSVKNLYYNYLPALIQEPTDTITLDYNNNFSFDLNLKNTKQISKFFIPYLNLSDNSNLKINYNSVVKRLMLTASFEELKYNKHTFTNLKINTFSNDSIFTILSKCNNYLLNNLFNLENFKTTSLTHNNNIDFKIDWYNIDSINYGGKILASTAISQKEEFGEPLFKITVLPSQVIVKDSLWIINKSQIKIDTSSFSVSSFNINHGNQYFGLDGKISENPDDTLFFDFRSLNLANLNVITKEKKLEFGGIINGTANFSSIFSNPVFYTDIDVNNLVLNKENFGHAKIYSRWIEENKAIQLEASTLYNDTRTINVSGNYYPENKNIMFNIILNKLGLNVLNPYLKSFASNVTGIGDGSVLVTGTLKHPDFNGSLFIQNSAMTIDYINNRYNFDTEVEVVKNSLIFKDVSAFDTYGNKGITNGFLKFGQKKEINFEFNINANNIFALNTVGTDNEAFYGTAFATGIVNIIGNREATFMDISARTEKNTKINIPLTYLQNSEETGFITFKDKSNKYATKPEEYKIDLSNFKLNMDLEITPDAEALLIFDSKIGDVIKGRGEGNIKMGFDATDDFKMYGDFIIEEGDYLFTLQNVINKRFKIKRGGSISWNGEPYNANIDFDAIYSLKTSLNSLVDSNSTYYSNDDYKKRIPVECQVFLTDNLMNPNINFDINLPTADEEAKTLVRTAINTKEKLNKQFLSLLVLNSFMRDQTADGYLSGASSTVGLGTVTTSELLSNQLSHWLSQISDEWDIGVNYRPGDEISQDQVEVALSTQLLDDRVSINGNVGYGGQTVEQASNIVGDFSVDVKINKSGKLQVRAFNESNDKLLYEDTPYTQGVGIYYREEFNTFSELLSNFWNKISRKSKETKSD